MNENIGIHSQVIRSLSTSAVKEGEAEEEQYPFGEAPTENDVRTISGII